MVSAHSLPIAYRDVFCPTDVIYLIAKCDLTTFVNPFINHTSNLLED
jgi:hypothetical protein